MATITSANSVFTLTAMSVFPVPQVLQGYAADDAFTTESLQIADVTMGVDGKLSAGYVPNPTKVTVMLQADSPSIVLFDAIIAATKVTRNVVYLDGHINLPSTGKQYVLVRGVLTNVSQVPDAKKVLQPHKYEITFESVYSSVVPL